MLSIVVEIVDFDVEFGSEAPIGLMLHLRNSLGDKRATFLFNGSDDVFMFIPYCHPSVAFILENPLEDFVSMQFDSSFELICVKFASILDFV